MRLRVVVPVVALLSASLVARADTVMASAISTFTLTPSADTLSFGAISTTVSVPGSFIQPGVFTGGNSGSLIQIVPVAFSDTVTVDGITKVLHFTGTDNVASTVNVLNINAPGPVAFNNLALTFTPATASVTFIGEGATVNLNGRLVVTPEPSGFVLLGSGLLGIAGLLRRRLRF